MRGDDDLEVWDRVEQHLSHHHQKIFCVRPYERPRDCPERDEEEYGEENSFTTTILLPLIHLYHLAHLVLPPPLGGNYE